MEEPEPEPEPAQAAPEPEPERGLERGLEPEPELPGDAPPPPCWERVSAGCSAARGATLRNKGDYGGGLLRLPAPPPPSAGWRVRWVLHYERGEPIVGLVDASIADVDGSAIFYDPSFCGVSCKRGSVWRGEVAILQASDYARRCPKGSVLRCELRSETGGGGGGGGGGGSGPVIFSVDRLADDGAAPAAAAAPVVDAAGGGGDGAIGPGVENCEAWSIRRLRQWLQLYDPLPHPEPPRLACSNAGADDERPALAARARSAAAWLRHDEERAAAAGAAAATDGGAGGGDVAAFGSAGDGTRWERQVRVAVDPGVSAWAGACYSAGSFKVTVLRSPSLECLDSGD